MAHAKKSSLITYGRALNDLGVAFVEAVEQAGGNDDDARRIFKDEVLRARLGMLIMGKLKLALQPCQLLVPHLLPDWVVEVVEDVEPTLTEGMKLSFPSFLRDGETRVSAQVMRSRAKEMAANKGLSDVPALLGLDGRGMTTIPAELRGAGKIYIILAGTLLRHLNGDLFVPYFYWDVALGWVLGFSRLDHSWILFNRLVYCE